MARNRRRDLASVSFHYLQKERRENGQYVLEEFSRQDFDQLADRISRQPWPDLNEDGVLERVRSGALVPFRNFEQVNGRTFRGTYLNAYSGHAFQNSEKGKISAASVNQREFHYLAYLSDEGQILASQYLGTYGGYGALNWGIRRQLGIDKGIFSYSFRRETYDPQHIRPKEVHINIASRGRDDEENALTRRRVVVLKRLNSKDEDFEDAAREGFVPIMQADDLAGKKNDLVRLLTDNGLISAADEDVEDCVMVADIDGKQRTLQVIGDSHFATRFPLNVPYNADGHPEPEPTKDAMLATLRRQIIDLDQ